MVQSPATRNRSESCRSTTAPRAATSRSSSRSAGTDTTTDWLNGAMGPPSPANQPMIGVAGTGPLAGTSSRRPASGSGSSAPSSASAMWATLWCSKTSRTESVRPFARARLTSWMERMLSPPRSKNPSSTPTDSRPSASANSAHSSSSRAVVGARPVPAAT